MIPLKKVTKKKGIKRVLTILILAPLVVVAEYFFILTFALPYSDSVTTENAFFLSLVGGALTLISLYLAKVAIIVFTALGILAVCVVYLYVPFGYALPPWILSLSTLGIMLLSLGCWLKTRKKQGS